MSALPPLTGHVALVAGGSGPLGARVAHRLAAAGASVAVHAHTNVAAAETIAAQLPKGVAVAADLTEPTDVETAFAEVERVLGPVRILVNAAHAAEQDAWAVADLPLAELDRHLGGVRSHQLLCRRALPGMRAAGSGRIVYVAGALMARPAEGMAAYGAAKAAASVLTRYVALEEGRHGITANVVAPGRIVEPGEPEPTDPQLRALSARLLERMSLGRFPTYDEVAAAIVALVLPEMATVTGQTVWATGGEPIASP